MDAVEERAPPPAQVLQPQLLSELVAVQVGLPGAEAGVGVGQGPHLGDGELRGAERGVHVGAPHRLLRQLRAASLGEEVPEGWGRGDTQQTLTHTHTHTRSL